MQRAILVAILCLLCLATVAEAQTKVQPYAFVSIEAPNYTHSSYAWNWARVGVKAMPKGFFGGQEMIHLEYDLVTSQVKYSYLKWDHSAGSGQISVVAGKYLALPQWSYPAPKSLQLTRWVDAEGGQMPIYCTGVALWYSLSNYQIQMSQYDHDRFGLRLAAGPVSGYWLSHTCYGRTLQQSFGNWLNPFTGFTVYYSHRTVWFVQNSVALPQHLRAFGQFDFGQTGQEENYLAGLTWEYSPNSFVKAFYEPRLETFQMHATFSF
ncbi:MAG: hypothetical protein C3F02_03220 [Parcubacteria group bacterium]|nr:MAG: hypothetical protein C3F02_03220 [Parcubacteria group bacterium]